MFRPRGARRVGDSDSPSRSASSSIFSACDANVEVRRAGEGVASPKLALHMTGARAGIMSLGKGPDEATTDERGRPKYTTRDWAAWVLTGDPR